MSRSIIELLWILVLGALLEALFIVLGGPPWFEQRLGRLGTNSGLWLWLPLLPAWGLLLGWYVGRHFRVVPAAREFHRLRESERRFMEVTDALAEGLLLFDPNGRLLYMNPEAERLLGWSSDELANRNIHQLIHRHEREPVPPEACAIQTALTTGQIQRVENDAFLRKDGRQLAVSYAAAPMLRGDRIVGVVTVFKDISERQRLLDELERMATHDALTGLVNRGELERRLAEELHRAQRYQRPLSVLMVDIDHFKNINDSHGHQAGDQVLKAFALRLAEHARRADTVARYGGEEFVLILPETPVAAATVMAERLHASLNESPITAAGVVHGVTASIGVAAYPAHGKRPSELLRASDDAMYVAKKKGRNRVHTSES